MMTDLLTQQLFTQEDSENIAENIVWIAFAFLDCFIYHNEENYGNC